MTQRWTYMRKARIVEEILAGRIAMADACAQHDLSIEEVESWIKIFKTYGHYGLRTTRLQCYQPERRQRPGGRPRPIGSLHH